MNALDVSKNAPLPLFNHLAVEISSMCNRTCVFCPNHFNARPDEQMSMAVIEKIVAELKALKWRGRFAPYIYNEPMRDPRFLDIVRYVAKELPGASIMISTNGDYLKSAKQLAEVYDAGVRQVILNVYAATDGCGVPAKEAKGVVAATKRAAQLEQWVADLGLETGKDMYGHAPAKARRARVERKYGITADSTKLAQFELQNRSGNIPWFQPSSEPLQKMCVRPWRSLNLNWKGEAILCCNDYYGVTNFGSVADRSIVELWNSEDFNLYRLHLQNKDRNINLCDKCDFGGGSYRHLVTPVTFGSEAKDKAAMRRIIHASR